MQLVSYNIHLEHRLEVILKEFQKRGIMENTAVFCIQEAIKDETGNTCEKILQAFPHLPLQYRLESFSSRNGKSQGNAIIYRSDIFIERKYHTFEIPKFPVERIPWLQKIFARNFKMPKIICQQISLENKDGEIFGIFNTHLDLSHNWNKIIWQMHRILRRCQYQSWGADAIYLCGDFNTVTFMWGGRKFFRKIREFFVTHRFHDLTSHIKNTYQLKPAEVKRFVSSPILAQIGAHLRIPLRLKLDWILVRSHSQAFIQPASRIKMPGSDHYPVSVKMNRE